MFDLNALSSAQCIRGRTAAAGFAPNRHWTGTHCADCEPDFGVQFLRSCLRSGLHRHAARVLQRWNCCCLGSGCREALERWRRKGRGDRCDEGREERERGNHRKAASSSATSAPTCARQAGIVWQTDLLPSFPRAESERFESFGCSLSGGEGDWKLETAARSGAGFRGTHRRRKPTNTLGIHRTQRQIPQHGGDREKRFQRFHDALLFSAPKVPTDHCTHAPDWQEEDLK